MFLAYGDQAVTGFSLYSFENSKLILRILCMSKLRTYFSVRGLTGFFLTITLTFALLINPNATQHASADVVNSWYVLNWKKKPTLYLVDKSTGALTTIATALQDTGTDSRTGAAGFDVDSTNAVGYFIPYSNNPASLWKVDLISGQFTYIANSDAINVTAFDIGNNGEIWVAADSLDGGGRGFGRVNTSTGDSTFLTAVPERISALATSANGTLYAFAYSNNVYTINTSTYAFTRVGTLPGSFLAADFDASGDIILTDWSGNISRYNLGTNTTTFLFQARDANNQAMSGTEAFGVGGPTNGQTLGQAIANPQNIQQPTAVVPIVAKDLGNIFFSSKSSRLTKDSKVKLRQMVESDQTAKYYKIEGYVQFNKGKKQDRKLALARASAVKTYMESLGVTLEILVEESFAPSDISESPNARMARILSYGS